jgi:preprotein translocase subunit SecB
MEKTRLDVDIPVTPVQVHAQYVKDFSFENPGAPDSLRPGGGQPALDVNIILDAHKIEDEANPDLYETALTLTVKSMRDGKILFISEIVYAALVTLKSVPTAHIKPILYVEVPQMLFPFARQMVANAVSAGGFPPLLLNPVDFRNMYADNQKRETATNGGAAAA